MSDKAFLSRLTEVKDLPTLPSVYTKLRAMLSDENATAKEIGKLLAEDPSLTVRVLKIANSAYYGVAHEVRTVTQAVVVLGFQTMKSTVLGSAVVGMFRPPMRAHAAYTRDDFWLHSLAVAAGARMLARKKGMADPEEAFVAGLLHDVGKIVLDQHFPDEFEAILNRVEADQCWIRDAEEAVLGVTHEEIGVTLVERWGLPDTLCDAVRNHHQPERGGVLAAMVHVADIFARTLCFGSGGDTTIPDRSEAALQKIDLEEIELDLLIAECATEAEGAKVFLE